MRTREDQVTGGVDYMEMLDIIMKKRNGGKLSREEIAFAVNGFTKGEIPDYQMSAFLMAVYFKGMDADETFELTDVMRLSGDIVDLSRIKGVKVDKHSTGGVGDKTTLIVAPIVASRGVPVAKMSGRGLGFSGGTIDKLEAIRGYRTELTEKEFFEQIDRIGIALIGQTGMITPADKKIYALRDVTGTVENMSLIASSIMSKKLAAGSDAIVLDVKCGSGAFMHNIDDARELARIMCEIGDSAGKKTVAMITDMDQPLGNAVGNALEVEEAVQTLKGEGPEDITELSVRLAGMMIALSRGITPEEGTDIARGAITDGSALEKLKELVAAQGGDTAVIDDTSLLPKAECSMEIKAGKGGFVTKIDAEKIGIASRMTGAGREKKDDVIDPAAGIMLRKKRGDITKPGEVLAVLYGKDRDVLAAAAETAGAAFEITESEPEKVDLIKEIIGA